MTYAYSLEEITRMIAVLPLQASAAVACAGFAGFSRSELRGLEWSNYSGQEIRVTQAAWKGFLHGPKTAARKASVPRSFLN